MFNDCYVLGNMLSPPLTCDDINGTESKNGVYRINPEHPYGSSFSVYCNFSGNIPGKYTIMTLDKTTGIMFQTWIKLN